MDRDSGRGGVLYAAFTGKAALVMTRKGTPASTIHSLIYKVWEATPEEIAAVEQELAELRAEPGRHGPGRAHVRRGAGPAASSCGSRTCTGRASC